MKWIGIGIAALLLAIIAYGVYAQNVTNPRIVAELRQTPQGERAGRVMLLSLPDGRTLPVNYLREGQTVYAGADGPWWKQLRGDGASVTLWIRGQELRGHARAIENDPVHTRDVFTRLRPAVPKWLPGWLDATLVQIAIDASTQSGAPQLRFAPR